MDKIPSECHENKKISLSLSVTLLRSNLILALRTFGSATASPFGSPSFLVQHPLSSHTHKQSASYLMLSFFRLLSFAHSFLLATFFSAPSFASIPTCRRKRKRVNRLAVKKEKELQGRKPKARRRTTGVHVCCFYWAKGSEKNESEIEWKRGSSFGDMFVAPCPARIQNWLDLRTLSDRRRVCSCVRRAKKWSHIHNEMNKR